jgi:taurine dioxygenase
MVTSTLSRLKVAKYGGYLGAILTGVDLREKQDESVYAGIRSAFDENGVIFLPDQDLSMEQYVHFAGQIGEVTIGNGIASVPGFPAVQAMIKEPTTRTGVGDMWHVDQSWRPNPIKATLLRSVDIPPFGGDTLFLSAAAAFDALPEAMKNMLRGMRAVHTRVWFTRRDPKFRESLARSQANGWKSLDGTSKLDDVSVHPVVTIHPGTGREVLFLNPGYTSNFEGWTEEESAPLLKQLFDHCQQPEFQCRYKWKPNAIACWDNRQVWHYAANDYQGHRREMYRMMVD